MGIHIYGNDPNQTLTVASGDISGNLVIFGNGAGDHVEAHNGNVTQNVITFGDGGGDFVVAPFNLNQDTITFGNGEGDEVGAGNANQDVIVFGKGGGDIVETVHFVGVPGSVGNLSSSSITFHDIASDASNLVFSESTISNSQITFGNADSDEVFTKVIRES